MKRLISFVAMIAIVLGTRAMAQTPTTAPAKDAAAKGQEIIDKALEFLKKQQKPDGGWHGEKEPPAITAVVLRAMVLSDKYTSKNDFVLKGYQRLLSYQLENGGIYKDMLANYNTAIAISAFAAANDPTFKEKLDKAVEYLKSLQWNETISGGPKGEGSIDIKNPWFGGAGYGGKARPDGSNTQIFIEALHDAGLKSDDPAFQKALQFITRMQNLSETNDQPWAGDDGGFVYTPANGGESFAGEYTTADGKRMLRSYGSMTYAGLKSMIYAGLDKRDKRVQAAWDWICKNWTLDENPGLRANNPENVKHGMYYYYHTLARALSAYGEPIIVDPQGKKHDWRVELIDKLATLQREDGSFVGDKRWMEDNAVMVTAFVVLSLEETRADLAAHPVK